MHGSLPQKEPTPILARANFGAFVTF